MKTKIILNPYANRWGALAKVPAIENALREAGLDFDLFLMSRPGDGIRETITAIGDGYEAIIAAGGDGTVSEVVNGLISAAGDKPTKPMGILPFGTGNDFSDMAQVPRDLVAAVNTIVDGKTRQIDAAQVIADDRRHFFGNNCALAMEPVVTIENIRLTRLSGNIRYAVATLKALLKLQAWQMKITWDSSEYEGSIYLLSVCNSPRTGGIFQIAPLARMDDGILDIVFVPKVPKTKVLSLVPRLLSGSHIQQPDVTYVRTTQLLIKSDPGTPIHADGEVIAESVKRIRYKILPGKITLLTPENI
jgi:YegS/Rv2252/BmrU family lipid kinase